MNQQLIPDPKTPAGAYRFTAPETTFLTPENRQRQPDSGTVSSYRSRPEQPEIVQHSGRGKYCSLFTRKRTHKRAILFTPRTPRRFFMLLLLAAIWTSPVPGIAQNTPQVWDLYSLDLYEASLKAWHRQKTEAEAAEFSALNRKKWWYYLPNVGIQFGFPSVSFGTSTLAEIDRDRQQRQIRLEAIYRLGNLNYQNDLHQLRQMYRALLIDLEQIRDEFPVINRSLISILRVAVDANIQKQITPVELHEANLRYDREMHQQTSIKRAYRHKLLELERFAHYDFPAEVLFPADSMPGLSRQR